MGIQTIEAKTGLAGAMFPEAFLVSLYRVLAPYRGCAHGCKYCDGRAEKYYVEGDFEKDICVRSNLPAMVSRDISAGIGKREYGAVCIGSGVTDVYQPIERELCLTRRTIEALIPSQLPIVILTKNDLILRDFDLLAQFPKALVIFTVTATDPEIARIIEPVASVPSDRLAAVQKAKKAGFFSGILAMPLCPGISDTDKNTASLFGSGADFIYPGGLTLRPGKQKDLFISLVRENFPELEGLYDRVYGENRQSGMPLMSYAAPLMRKWNTDLEKMHVPQMIPHRIYRELLSQPDALFVLLCHMQSLYSVKGIDTRPLKEATGRYGAWLKENRSTLRRKRIPLLAADPFPITRILTEKLDGLCRKEGGFEAVCGNAKLSALVSRLIKENKIFDYPSLAAMS